MGSLHARTSSDNGVHERRKEMVAARLLSEKHPFVDGLLVLEREHLCLLPNSVFEARINNGAKPSSLPGSLSAWFSPITAYVLSGQELGEAAVRVNGRYYLTDKDPSTDLTLHFPVPES